jgi:hypothetical protein
MMTIAIRVLTRPGDSLSLLAEKEVGGISFTARKILIGMPTYE